MARVMMLVSDQGETLAETRFASASVDAAHDWERILRNEAAAAGFSEDAVLGANIVIGGDFSG